jgi:hypothetical protein
MLSLAAALLAGCGNPVLDARIEALGGEADGVEPGEFHRPGQPCVLCHGKYGGAEPQMSVGGTIFAAPTVGDGKPLPVEGVKVLLFDAEKKSPPNEIKTNCIGNFYVTVDDWNPSFPLHAEIEYGKPGAPDLRRRQVMSTWIQRDGSCAGCHVGSRNQGSPGWVFCAETNPGFVRPEAGTCEGYP